MNHSERKSIAIGLLFLSGAFALKWWYRTATVDELGFMLAPVSKLVSLITGSPSTYTEGQGHLFPHLAILIDRSCSGINFLVIAVASLTLLWMHRLHAGAAWPLLALLIPAGAWALAILANTGRILLLVQLDRFGLHPGHTMHQGLGAFFFLASLLLSCIVFDRFLHHHSAHRTTCAHH